MLEAEKISSKNGTANKTREVLQILASNGNMFRPKIKRARWGTRRYRFAREDFVSESPHDILGSIVVGTTLLDIPLSEVRFSLPKTETNISVLRSGRGYILRNLDDESKGLLW